MMTSAGSTMVLSSTMRHDTGVEVFKVDRHCESCGLEPPHNPKSHHCRTVSSPCAIDSQSGSPGCVPFESFRYSLVQARIDEFQGNGVPRVSPGSSIQAHLISSLDHVLDYPVSIHEQGLVLYTPTESVMTIIDFEPVNWRGFYSIAMLVFLMIMEVIHTS